VPLVRQQSVSAAAVFTSTMPGEAVAQSLLVLESTASAATSHRQRLIGPLLLESLGKRLEFLAVGVGAGRS